MVFCDDQNGGVFAVGRLRGTAQSRCRHDRQAVAGQCFVDARVDEEILLADGRVGADVADVFHQGHERQRHHHHDGAPVEMQVFIETEERTKRLEDDDVACLNRREIDEADDQGVAITDDEPEQDRGRLEKRFGFRKRAYQNDAEQGY